MRNILGRKRKKIYMNKIIGAVLSVAIVSNIFPISNVRAAEDLTAENFDYDWYLQKHPDLAALYTADDHKEIWNFYQTTGEPAGWIGRRSKSSYLTKYNFDYDTFLGRNPDVLACFGTDHDAIYDWYMTTGIYEGRIAQTTYEDTNVRMEMYDLVNTFTNNAMSDWQKVKAVHDWLCIHVAYDIDNYYAGTIPEASYSVVGPIKNGKAVCQGYAETFQQFMDILGIENEFIAGKATNPTGYTSGHAWNKVKVEGNWYYVDVTWDDPLPDRQGTVYGYDYFMISEEQMNRDHYPVRY